LINLADLESLNFFVEEDSSQILSDADSNKRVYFKISKKMF